MGYLTEPKGVQEDLELGFLCLLSLLLRSPSLYTSLAPSPGRMGEDGCPTVLERPHCRSTTYPPPLSDLPLVQFQIHRGVTLTC